MNLFPIFLKLEGRRCLVVGGGHVGAQKIAGLLCFFNEKVDLFIDGVHQDSPRTKFS